MNTIITRAQEFAHMAHDSIGQVRKYSGDPYWVHTDAVAGIVERAGGTPAMIAAAHLHDVLEDVAPLRVPFHKFGFETIRERFGDEVFRIVFGLTDIFTHESYPYLNRATRKTLEANRLGWERADVQTVKLADIIHNTEDIVRNDPKFAKTYLTEKHYLLFRMTSGDPGLYKIASIQAWTHN